MKTFTASFLSALIAAGVTYGAIQFFSKDPEAAPIEKPHQHIIIVKQNKGQHSEACPELKKGQTLTIDFKAKKEVLFNLHYHEGEAITYPIEETALTTLKQRFVAPVDQTYCIMWEALENGTLATATYSVE